MKIYQRILRRAVVLGLVVGLPQSALAEAITLEQALERAEAANPVLATARSEQAGRAAAANAFTLLIVVKPLLREIHIVYILLSILDV